MNGRTVANNLAAAALFGDFAQQIGGFFFEFAKAVFGGQLILDIAENQAEAGSVAHFEA